MCYLQDHVIPTLNTSAAYEEYIHKTFGSEAATVLSILPAPVGKEASEDAVQSQVTQLATDMAFGVPAYAIAESMANRSEKAYLYMFTQVPSGEAGKNGVVHAFEIPYIFNYTTDSNPIDQPPVSNPELAETMVTYWTQFARTGDPNTQGVPEWKPFNTSDEEWQILGPEVGSEPIPEDTKALYNAVETLNLNKAVTAFMNQQFTNPLTLFL